MFGAGWKPQEFWASIHPASCDVIIMQSTGLTDKNGVEIFEGDFLSRPSGAYKVVWNRDGFYMENPCGSLISILESERLLVIGNIHENPKLLEDQQ